MAHKARYIRYLILLLILFGVAAYEAWVKLNVASWEDTLTVRISAINGDSRRATEGYINSLKATDYEPIADLINREARRYNLNSEAIHVEFIGEIDNIPPQPPLRGSMLDNIIWSLKFRYWALMRSFDQESSMADIDLFIIYYDVETVDALPHSVGLRGGMIGLINAFASRAYRGSNQLVVAHELMHTLGASDKYTSANEPMHPRGYADPYRIPLFPQTRAEIMGGRIPVSKHQSKMPESLDQVVVGAFTAAEINWPGD